METNKRMIVVDHSFGLVIDKEKAVLANELMKHFVPRMTNQYNKERSEGKTPDIRNYIASAMKSISLDCEIVELNPEVFGYLSILEGADGVPAPALTSEKKENHTAAAASPHNSESADDEFVNPMAV